MTALLHSLDPHTLPERNFARYLARRTLGLWVVPGCVGVHLVPDDDRIVPGGSLSTDGLFGYRWTGRIPCAMPSAVPAASISFARSRGKYLALKQGPAWDVGAAPGTTYTCPMHPEVIQDHPGDCPKCGMALEPMMVSADEGPDPELINMTRRFWIGVVLTVPILVLTMGSHVPGLGLGRLVPPLLSQ
jgi:hypothetical protein